ncbi:ABC transporter permease [Streptomyces sp. NPDC052042]|uniref:ABC transporter permease n=1 Tax=Streptomyces sp. NPDC052042 TaxID=3365683 RepID=UPI0037D4C5AA
MPRAADALPASCSGPVPLAGTAGVTAGLDTLERTPPSPHRPHPLRSCLPILSTLALVLIVWQLAHALGWFPRLPSPADVGDRLARAWTDAVLPASAGYSAARCLAGFMVSAALGIPLGLLLARVRTVRTLCGPALSSVQSLPAAALVPMVVIPMGESEAAVYAVLLLGAVPSVAVGVLHAVDQVPRQLLRAGRSMGATGPTGAVLVVLPAALPGLLAALRQGWTFGWRALMTAELITRTPLPGIGRMLQAGKESGDLAAVVAAVLIVLTIGVLIEAVIFAPLERRIRRNRGMTTG